MKIRKCKRLQEKLSKFDWREIREFENKFPCEATDCTHIKIITADNCILYVAMDAKLLFADFYTRWRRFNTLKAFI